MALAWRVLFLAAILFGGVKGAEEDSNISKRAGKDDTQVNGPWDLVHDGNCYDRHSGGVTVLSCQAGETLQQQMKGVISGVATLFSAFSALPFRGERFIADISSLRDSLQNLSTVVGSLSDDLERVTKFVYSSHVCPVYLKTQGWRGEEEYQTIWGIQSPIPQGLGEILFFAIKGCGGASVLLRARALGSPEEEEYEIEVDEVESNRSSIRRGRVKHPNQGDSSGRGQRCGQFRKFYITWREGVVQLGTVSECRLPDEPFLTYRDDSPFEVGHIYVASRTGPVWWAVDSPCLPNDREGPTGDLSCAAHPALDE